MSAERDTPRGPTSEQLRRRVLATTEWTIPPGLEGGDWVNAVCSCRPGSGKCTRCRALDATGLSTADTERWRRRWDTVPWPPLDPHA